MEEWGTICNHNWDLEDATVACRQLGYSKAISADRITCYGEESRKSWMDDLRCRGNEIGLQYCAFSGWGNNYCLHFEDAGVTCQRRY